MPSQRSPNYKGGWQVPLCVGLFWTRLAIPTFTNSKVLSAIKYWPIGILIKRNIYRVVNLQIC